MCLEINTRARLSLPRHHVNSTKSQLRQEETGRAISRRLSFEAQRQSKWEGGRYCQYRTEEVVPLHVGEWPTLGVVEQRI